MLRTCSLALLALIGCGPRTAAQTQERLADAVDRQMARQDTVRHAVLHVHDPRGGLDVTVVRGVARDGDDAPMTADTPFLSASIGKLFLATSVHVLADQDRLSLDDPITAWLDRDVLAGLPVEGGDAALEDIRVRHLLSQRSGLPDYFDGTTRDGADTVFTHWREHPERVWTRAELLDHTRAHFDPIGAPGETFAYSDTNYTLLGLIVESVTGASFQETVQREVIEPLGLEHTRYHHPHDGSQAGPDWAGAWAGDVELAHAPCLAADQAGGGLVTTSGDLARFLRALSDGTPVSLDALDGGADHTRDAITRGIGYGHGLWHIRPGRVFIGAASLPDMVGVSGSTGSFAYYVPEYDAVITGTFDQMDMQEQHIRFLMSQVLPALARAERVDATE